jgi:signal-transduction protein with cAMP-binding, CBS, and nucleotidyltransferase domain
MPGLPALLTTISWAERVPREEFGMKVGDLMQIEALTAGTRECLSDAAQRMRENGVGSLAVMSDDDRMVGILTEHDLVRAMADGLPPRGTSVASCMTAELVTVDMETDASEAAALMVAKGIRHLPVMDRDSPIGMISARDLLLLETWPSLLSRWA